MKKKISKILKRMLYIFLGLIILIAIIAAIILNQAEFGKLPSGERLARIEKSPNYKNGKFHNLSETPQLTSDKSFFENLYLFIFPEVKDLKPSRKIPAIQTNLKETPLNEDIMVWLGHSSYYMQVSGKRLLVDPVFHSASPFSFMVKPFDAEYNYSSADLPEIDLLIITHDHWDHLDYTVMKEMKDKIKKVLCPLGVGAHLEYWGFKPEQITELDWNEKTFIDNMKFTCLPTRHFSGRGIQPTKTLWASFMLESEKNTLYIGGDSGYDTHFIEIAKQFPNIDLAILENGQYNEDWRYIHLLPEDLHKAMKDLKAKRYFAGHNSKFALGRHSWYEPLNTIDKITKQDSKIHAITPKIGEIVKLNENQTFEKWW